MLKFIIKGLLRDHHRSFFPILMVSAGVFLSVFFYTWMQGVMGDLVRSNAQYSTGHVKIMTRAYNELSDQIPNDLAFVDVKGFTEQIDEKYPNMVWVERIRFGGLLDIPDDLGDTRSQGPVSGIGVDLLSPNSLEIEILNLENALVRGRLPNKENEILISSEFADKLGVDINDTATLLSSTMNGSMAMYNFKIAGIIKFGFTSLDRSSIIADIRGVQLALDMQDSSSEILGYTRDMVYDNKSMINLSGEFNNIYSNDKDEFSPIMLTLGDQNGLKDYLYMANTFGFIIVAVFIFAMSIVLWNSGLINGIRRYGEIGVRLAMGESKGSLYRWMIGESIVIGIIGSIVGTLIGLSISYYLQYVGIDLGDMLQKSTVLFPSEIRARVTFVSYIIGFIPGLIAPVLGTVFAGIGIYRRQTAQLFNELEV